jgi:hypothetical protein
MLVRLGAFSQFDLAWNRVHSLAAEAVHATNPCDELHRLSIAGLDRLGLRKRESDYSYRVIELGLGQSTNFYPFEGTRHPKQVLARQRDFPNRCRPQWNLDPLNLCLTVSL